MTIIANYLASCAELLGHAVTQARQEDAEGVQGLARVLQAGELLTLRSTFAPTTGIAQVCIEVIEPSGQAHTLMTADLAPQSLRF